MSRRVAAVALAALALAAPAAAGPNLVVGVADDSVRGSQAAAARARLGLVAALGAEADRITAVWSPGQTAPDATLLPQYVSAAQGAALLGIRLYLEVYPAPGQPVDAGQFAAFVEALALALPQVRDVVVGARPNDPAYWVQGAGGYLALLAPAYDALKSVDSGIRVLGSVAAAPDPVSFLLALGAAYRASGRSTPVLDGLALAPTLSSGEPPATAHPGPGGTLGIGDYPRLVATLGSAFDGTAQPGSTLPIVYDGYAVQTAVPSAKAPLYTGAETDPAVVSEAQQAGYYTQALQLAYCQPTVGALLLQNAVDDSDLRLWQSGLAYPDLSHKSDWGAVRSAIVAARRGSLAVCPGTAPAPAPVVLRLDSAARAVTVSCERDCWFVAGVERTDGVPVRARQGFTAGGGTPAVASFVKPPLRPGAYRLFVRVLSRYNAGDGLAQESDPFTVG